MDLVSTCKDKLAYFRIKELKEVLTQLGLPKQGRKQDLVQRILAVLSDELDAKLHRNSVGKDVAKIIDDIHRKMQNTTPDLASGGHSGSDINNVKPKEDLDDSFQMDMKVRCPCGNTLPTESMIQCEDTRCRVWQHINCVMIPEKPMEGVPPVPPQYHCEICRLSRADPFWVSVAHPLPPVKLATANIPTDGTNPVQTIDKAFQLTRADRDLLLKNEYDVQAWCILLNDKVPFRMQWPQFSDLQINGVPIRTTNRPGSQLLGANGRDDGPAITACTREGINKIFLSACDARIFCLGVRIARRRTVQQILNLIPKEVDGEPFVDALARVCRCVGGGNATDNADSDSDLEVVADSITVNLRCPMSGSRMRTAGRFKPCIHMGCFDLDTFVELNQRSRKWQCPICLKNYALENVIIDPYFNRITNMMRGCGEDITDIEVKPDGSWRVKNENERRELAQWHNADGSLCIISTDRDLKPNLETLKQVKQEGGSEGHSGLKIGIKKNRMGVWQVSKPDSLQSLSSENRFEEKPPQCERVLPMSSSATGSCRDGEDPSVNQGGAELFDFSANNGNELDSISLNFDSPYGVNRISSAPTANADVIVLSDSDDENENLVSPDIVYGTGQVDAIDIPFPIPPPGAQGSYPEDPVVSTSGGIGIYPSNGNENEINLWSSLPTEGEPGFQLFNAEGNGPHNIADVQHPPINGYTLGADTTEPLHQVSYPACPSGNEVNGALMDNPLAFGGDDPSLQLFLPPRAAAASVQSNSRGQQDMSNGVRNEDWISLRLGGASSGDCGSTCANGLNSRKQLTSKEGRMETLADTASLLLSMSDGRSEKTTPSKQRLGGPFSHPRQPRSVRPRLYLSIDSDSE